MKKINFRSYCATESSSVRQIAELLNKSNLKILYITSLNSRLVGSVTDGDLRRAIINGINLDQNISSAMNTNPKSILRCKDELVKARVLMEKYNLSSIPVVDKNDAIMDIIPKAEQYSKKQIDNPVVIMAGGFGSRLMPFTKDTPKPMLKIGGKPILERIIDQFIEQGFHNFHISVYYLANQIKDYFRDGHEKGIQINYLEEDKPLGTGGCLSLLPALPQALPCLIVNGDILSTIDYESLINFHEENLSVATMAIRHLDIKVPFGVIEAKDTKLISIKEKPSLDVRINAGIYMLNQEVIRTIDKGTIHITDIFLSLLEQNKSVHCFPLVESWTDIGHHEDFKNAELNFEI